MLLAPVFEAEATQLFLVGFSFVMHDAFVYVCLLECDFWTVSVLVRSSNKVYFETFICSTNTPVPGRGDVQMSKTWFFVMHLVEKYFSRGLL